MLASIGTAALFMIVLGIILAAILAFANKKLFVFKRNAAPVVRLVVAHLQKLSSVALKILPHVR